MKFTSRALSMASYCFLVSAKASRILSIKACLLADSFLNSSFCVSLSFNSLTSGHWKWIQEKILLDSHIYWQNVTIVIILPKISWEGISPVCSHNKIASFTSSFFILTSNSILDKAVESSHISWFCFCKRLKISDHINLWKYKDFQIEKYTGFSSATVTILVQNVCIYFSSF